MSTLKTHNLQSPDSGSSNIALTPNAGMVVTGISTFSNNLDINANIDVTGVSTFQNNVHLLDNDKLLLGGTAGTASDLQIYHDGSHSYIDDAGTGNLYLRSGTLSIQNLAGSKTSVVFNSGGGQELYHNNSKKFETTGVGITVYGTTQTQQLNITGVTTASSFVGSGNVGVQTSSITHSALVGAGNSFVGMYIGDGSLVFNKYLNRTGGYYISTEVNALNAGPVSLGSTMTLDGTWVIV